MNTRSGFDLIPTTAWVLAGLGLVGPPGLVGLLFANGVFRDWFVAIIFLIMGSLLAGTILLSGYVYGDAARRGMPPGIWAAVAFLAPNFIGVVLYFALRKPIVHACSGCGRDVAADARFCSSCGAPQPSPAVSETA